MIKQRLKRLITEGKTKKAIEELMAFSDQLEDKDFEQQVIMQSSRYEQYARENRSGIISYEDGNISLARINNALIEIINGLPEEPKEKVPVSTATKPPVKNTPAPSIEKNWWKYIAGTAVIIGIFGSLAEVLNFINVFPVSSSESAALTIYVHGPDGQQDYLLENKGELLVDLDGDRRSAKIGEKGRTVFNEIPMKFKGQALPISVKADGYEIAEENKQFVWTGKPIYFAIQKDQELREVKGILKNVDDNDFLSDVLVLIENEFTTSTDSLGRFSFEMKPDQIKEKYTLSFKKEGYETLTEFYYPGSSAEFRLKKEK